MYVLCVLHLCVINDDDDDNLKDFLTNNQTRELLVRCENVYKNSIHSRLCGP